jgi:DNA-binding response OmpR family regulator
MPKVMLAEDDRTMLSLLQTLLEIEGYEVTVLEDAVVSRNPEGVLTTIRKERPDLVLLDVHLGEVNGIDLLERIREGDEFKNMRVLMSSGIDFSHECTLKGADGFIMKPYMPDELIAVIQKTLRD